MSGNKALSELHVSKNTSEDSVIDLRATSNWYGPYSPLFSTKKGDEFTLYHHIFFPTKL